MKLFFGGFFFFLILLLQLLLEEVINSSTLSKEVSDLVEMVWAEALGHLEHMLLKPMNRISLNDVSHVCSWSDKPAFWLTSLNNITCVWVPVQLFLDAFLTCFFLPWKKGTLRAWRGKQASKKTRCSYLYKMSDPRAAPSSDFWCRLIRRPVPLGRWVFSRPEGQGCSWPSVRCSDPLLLQSHCFTVL